MPLSFMPPNGISGGTVRCRFTQMTPAWTRSKAALAVMGTGFAFFQSPLIRTLVSSVTKETYGLASGMVETMRLAGMTISIAITTIIFTSFLGSTHITPAVSREFMKAIHVIFWIFLVISLGALLVTVFLKKRPADQA